MPFSVKSDLADELLAELRAITGEGITDAVVHALEDRLHKTKQRQVDSKAVLHTLWSSYPHLLWQEGEPEVSVTFNDWMYDEDGLPK